MQDETTVQSHKPRHGKKKFQEQWLEMDEFKDWLRPLQGDMYSCYCRTCNITLRCCSIALGSHASSAEHQDSSRAMSLRKSSRWKVFQQEWLSHADFEDWLEQVPDDEYKASCKVCRIVMLCGVGELQKHSMSMRHQRSMRGLQSTSSESEAQVSMEGSGSEEGEVTVRSERKVTQRKMKFQQRWLENAHFKDWLVPCRDDKYSCKCDACEVILPCSTIDLLNHTKSLKHIRVMKRFTTLTTGEELEVVSEKTKGSLPYRSKFQRFWLRDEMYKDWIQPIATDVYRCKCVACDTILNCCVKILQRHVASAKHKKCMKWFSKVVSGTSAGIKEEIIETELVQDEIDCFQDQNSNDSFNIEELEDTLDEDFEEESNSKKEISTEISKNGRIYRKKKFQDQWLVDERFKDWVDPVPDDPFKCLCVACDVTINCGTSELIKHIQTVKHKVRSEGFSKEGGSSGEIVNNSVEGVKAEVGGPSDTEDYVQSDADDEESVRDLQAEAVTQLCAELGNNGRYPFRMKFQRYWLRAPEFKDWIEPVQDDVYKARCAACKTIFVSITSILKIHAKSIKHRKCMKGFSKTPEQEDQYDLLLKAFEDAVGSSEAICEENLAMSRRLDLDESRRPSYLEEGKLKYRKKFQHYWLKEDQFKDWLRPVPGDLYSARCVVCDKKILCGISELGKHAKGVRHKKNFENWMRLSPSSKLLMSAQTDLAERMEVKSAEQLLATFYKEHNVDYQVVEDLVPVLRSAFPDSKIAQNLSLSLKGNKTITENVEDNEPSTDTGNENKRKETDEQTEQPRKKKFQPYWMENDEFKDWLAPVPTDVYNCRCLICNATFQCGSSELRKHAKSLKHKKNMIEANSLIGEAPTLQQSDFSSDLPDLFPGAGVGEAHCEQVRSAEMKVSSFYAEYRVSLDTVEHLLFVLRTSFEDSVIAQDLTMSHIIENVVALQESEKLNNPNGKKSRKKSAKDKDDQTTAQQAPKKPKLIIGKKRFLQHWLENDEFRDWLEPVPGDLCICRCIVCSSTLACGTNELLKHSSSARHRKNIKALRGATADSFVKCDNRKIHLEKVKAAEIRIALFYAEHNIALQTIEYLIPVLKSALADSEIVHDISLSRRKCSSIIEYILAPQEIEEIIQLLWTTKFFILLDESISLCGQKYLCIMARYVSTDTGFLNTELVEVLPYDPKENTPESIYNAVKACFYFKSIPLENILGIACEAASVLSGGVYDMFINHLKVDVPNLVVMQCINHTSIDIIDKACGNFPTNVDELLKSIVECTSENTRRCAEVKEIQYVFHCEKKKVPSKLLEVKSLVFTQCVEQLVANWSMLEAFFIVDVFEEEGNSNERFISDELTNPSTKAYFYFLKFALSYFKLFNALFQSRSIMMHILFEKSEALMRSFCKNFVQPMYMKSLSVLDFQHPDNLLPVEEIYLGPECNTFLRSFENKQDVRNIREVCQTFYIDAASELRNRLPLDNIIFKEMAFLQACTALHEDSQVRTEIGDLDNLMSIFSANIDQNQAQIEWRNLPYFFSLQQKKTLSTMNIDAMWEEIRKATDFSGVIQFSNIAALAQLVLTLPHSNAEAERVLSVLRDVRTKKRNKLRPELVNAVTLIRCRLQETNRNCTAFEVTKEHLALHNANKLYPEQMILVETLPGVVEPLPGVVEPLPGVVEPLPGVVEPIPGVVEPLPEVQDGDVAHVILALPDVKDEDVVLQFTQEEVVLNVL